MLNPGSLTVIFQLRFRVRTIQEEGYDLLKNLFTNVHSAMNAVARLYPIHFPNGNLPLLSFSAIAKLDIQHIALQNHSHPMKGVPVPWSRLSRPKSLPANQIVSTMM